MENLDTVTVSKSQPFLRYAELPLRESILGAEYLGDIGEKNKGIPECQWTLYLEDMVLLKNWGDGLFEVRFDNVSFGIRSEALYSQLKNAAYKQMGQ